MANADVFKALFERTLDVKLPSTNNEHSLVVRRMPFSLMTHILTFAATNLQAELRTAFLVFQSSITDPDKAKLNHMEFGIEVLSALLPSLTKLIVTSEHMLHEILSRVVLDWNDDVKAYLSPEDALAVLNAVLADMDKAVVATQVADIFFNVTEVGKALAYRTSETKN